MIKNMPARQQAGRIVYLITDLDVGGAENSLYQLVTHLDRKKFSPIVYSLSREGKIAQKLRAKGIGVVCLDAKNKFDIRVFFKLIKLLKKQKPNILHTYLFHANFTGRIAGRIAGIPIIISSVRVAEKEKKYHLYLDMITQWMVNKEICVSKEVEKFMVKKTKIPPYKLATIYNGINPLDFDLFNDEQKDKKRKELSISQFEPIIGTIARLSKQKGVKYLLKAFRLVLDDFPKSCLLVVGSGPEEKKLRELALRLNIANSVKFWGFREDATGIINIMDVFVLPSLWEGMPNAVLEAYVLGKPVIASKVDGVKEIIKDEKTGFFVPAGDYKSLAESIKTLIKSPKMMEQFGKKGKEFVSENFSIVRMVQDTENLYSELINQKLQ